MILAKQPKFYNEKVLNYVRSLPLLREQNWWVKLNLFFSLSYLVGRDSNGRNETFIWGKKFNGVIYIASATWSGDV